MIRRTYNEYCGVAKALDIVGERWTLLIVRNLLLGPLRYSDLHRGLPGITTNLLAKRLKEMAESGLIERIRTAASESRQAYRLTDLGLGLEPVVEALGAWGWNWMTGPEPTEHRNLEWLLVSTRRRYRGGTYVAAEFVVESTPYHFILEGDDITIGRGPLPKPDLRVRLAAAALVGLLLEGWPEDGVPDGVEVHGDMDRLQTLVNAFEHPAAAPHGGSSHGGRIRVDSRAGEGSTFSFTLPNADPGSLDPGEPPTSSG